MRILSLSLAAGLATVTLSRPLQRSSTSVANRNFEFFGVNESGPEFGEKVFPGQKNKHVCESHSGNFDRRIF
jgi:endoglucanase